MIDKRLKKKEKEKKKLTEIKAKYPFAGYSGSARPAYMSDLNQQAVFMSEDPSICILYNSSTNSHTIWKVRRAKQEVKGLLFIFFSAVFLEFF